MVKLEISFPNENVCLIFICFDNFLSLQVIRSDDSENWTLQIKFSQARDSGVYECQVNTEPKMSMAFRLNIVGKWCDSQVI